MNEETFTLWTYSIFLESLPISSSGHVTLIKKYFYDPSSVEFDKPTEHLMHIPNGIILTVPLLLFGFVYFTGNWIHELIQFTSSVALSCTVTGVVYLLFKKYGTPRLPLAAGFFISGYSLLSLIWAPSGTENMVYPFAAFLIGLAQAFSLLPGVSRMALTVVCTQWLGIDLIVGLGFSFACQWALIGAAVLQALFTPTRTQFFASFTQQRLFHLLWVTIASFFALFFSLISFIGGSTWYFGVYLIGLSIFLTMKSFFSQNHYTDSSN